MIAPFQLEILDLLFPKVCRYCGDNFQNGLSNILCRVCFDRPEPYEEPICDHCGMSLPAKGFEHASLTRCLDCGDKPYFLDQVRTFVAYEGPARIAHQAFKFEGLESLKTDIANKVMGAVSNAFWEGVEAIVPVPLSPEKERERGYNPANVLALELSDRTGIPARNLLRKVRSTAPQMSLSREKRFQNLKDAFATVAFTPLSRIVLVDDVFTTGSTLEECAKVLKRSGVPWVGAVVFARTPRHWSPGN